MGGYESAPKKSMAREHKFSSRLCRPRHCAQLRGHAKSPASECRLSRAARSDIPSAATISSRASSLQPRRRPPSDYALWQVTWCARAATGAYVARRSTEKISEREIVRCLKRCDRTRGLRPPAPRARASTNALRGSRSVAGVDQPISDTGLGDEERLRRVVTELPPQVVGVDT